MRRILLLGAALALVPGTAFSKGPGTSAHGSVAPLHGPHRRLGTASRKPRSSHRRARLGQDGSPRKQGADFSR